MRTEHFFPRARGFTLVELVVAMAVSLVLVLGMFELTAQGGRGFGRTQRSIQTQSSARAALHFMAEDLATRLVGTPLQTTSDAAAAWPCGTLGFFRCQAADSAGGDVVFVLYEVKSVMEGPGTSRQLIRSVWDSGEAFAALKDGRTPAGVPSSNEALALQVVGFSLTCAPRAGEPASCAVVLSVADDATARRLETEADWRAATARGALAIGAGHAAPASANVRSYQTLLLLE
jgi:prepilin-type N-terminal cleavage/methylation domain-containing protein